MSVLSEVSPASWEVQNQALKKTQGAEKKRKESEVKRETKTNEIGADRQRLYIKGPFVHYKVDISISVSVMQFCHALSASSPPFPQRKSPPKNHLLFFFDVKSLMSFWGLSPHIKIEIPELQMDVIEVELLLRADAEIVLQLLKWTWVH